VVERPLD